ncbi:helix-turn-helix domain-containing protein [[Mycobacterium] burgundiense]|uniref:Helix-turn-helix domain-containing protein n=1 Tax=[Mycobacterium] burgundiense TaxID=3064286 RepID=A0ABM9M1R2_9MYCO|nr:TetR/AcrR family transcriptional regulator [Mycolicibacterium sp. MU0053]CAJ1508628.1 helix-turn-helix domain-containing protein [Mycolicibacterium sp. MU0053]
MSSVRRRPRNRKAQIARAAAEAFGESGYHAVSMDDIAARVGISATALYRHAAGKYQLFRDAVLALGAQLADCTEFVETTPAGDDPVQLRERILGALIDTALTNRSSGGLYRRQARYLSDDDRRLLMDQLKLVNRRIQLPLRELRPDLTSPQRWTLSAAALSVIGSVADHHAQLGHAQIRTLLLDRAVAVLSAELPQGISQAIVAAPGEVSAGRYEEVLRASLILFHGRGYHQTGVEDIAAAVGMPASGIYRYFVGKADILAASFRRAADRVSADVANTLAAETDPDRALSRLIEAYIARSFDNPELAHVYHTERTNLAPADQKVLRNIQRATVEAWAQLVTGVQPEFGMAEAHFVVHGGFAVVIDIGRLMGHDGPADSEQARTWVRTLVRATLFGSADTPSEIPETDGIAVNLSA